MRHPNLEWLFWVPLLACPAVQAQGTSQETLLDKPAVAPVDEALPSVGALRSEAAASFVRNRTKLLALAIGAWEERPVSEQVVLGRVSG